MIKPENLFNMTNEELCGWFRKEIVEAEPDPEWKRRLEEYYNNIERDFQEEWSKKRCKWFFAKRRQKKLRYKVSLRYSGPVFWLIEEVVDDILGNHFQNSEFFNQFVDIKNISGDEYYFTEENQRNV